MTHEEKIEYLRGYRRGIARAEDLSRELAEANRLCEALPQKGQGMVCGAGLQALVNRMEQELNDCLRLRQEIEQAVGAIESPTQQRVLQLRYLSGLTVERIAERMFYSERQIIRLHKLAIDEFCPPEAQAG